ncbi:MAG: carbohydrate porin, partial [Colwellia sp.]
YAFYDTIPASAKIYNLNLSYSLPVEMGPITNLTFYNDYNLMTDKSGGLKEDTMMNVTGVLVTSGNLYTLIDYAIGKNQPFLGGSLAGDSDETNSRININFGFYF